MGAKKREAETMTKGRERVTGRQSRNRSTTEAEAQRDHRSLREKEVLQEGRGGRQGHCRAGLTAALWGRESLVCTWPQVSP